MSLFAAAVPVAVLVLAWDETTPAVRALVEATETAVPALDSVVVLVPATMGELTREEFLPLAAEPTSLPAATDETNVPAEITLAEADTIPPAAAALPTLLPLGAPAEALTPAALHEAPAPLVKSAVRTLHLSSFSLAELADLSSQALPKPIWQQQAVPPAAPYLGSQPAAVDSETRVLAAPIVTQPEAEAARSSSAESTIFSLSPTPPAAAQPAQLLPVLPASSPDYLLAELLPALDAEADLAPILADELAAEEVVPMETPLAEPLRNAQAGWSEALAALHAPLPIDEPATATDFEDEASTYTATLGEPPATANVAAELRPVSQLFEAPDLNFQVIQYARFAVPVALAQAPFAVIYAPAWPTWLAAQELRYRTQQPLVLHVATLAASAEGSLETATGWQAELQRQALRRADLILAETPELARRLRHDLGLASDLVRTVPAADADAVAQALRTARLRSSGSAG